MMNQNFENKIIMLINLKYNNSTHYNMERSPSLYEHIGLDNGTICIIFAIVMSSSTIRWVHIRLVFGAQNVAKILQSRVLTP